MKHRIAIIFLCCTLFMLCFGQLVDISAQPYTSTPTGVISATWVIPTHPPDDDTVISPTITPILEPNPASYPGYPPPALPESTLAPYPPPDVQDLAFDQFGVGGQLPPKQENQSLETKSTERKPPGIKGVFFRFLSALRRIVLRFR